MNNYLEYKDKVAFHPGYYIKEIVEDSGLTQEDFAKRLATTPKNLSILIRGEQSLSIDIAMKLSRLLGTSANYWLNIQAAYDSLLAEYESEQEMEEEKRVFDYIDYKYFRDNFGLPDLPRKKDQQIEEVRKFLRISTLSVLKQRDMAVNFRSSNVNLMEKNIIKANIMVQISTNAALDNGFVKFNKRVFEEKIEYALTLTRNHDGFYPLLSKAFSEAGVVLVILPNIPGSQINGATKKVGDSIVLTVNNRRLMADSFWFTLFHEIGHIISGDYGISFEKEKGNQESEADKYAENKLIPPGEYKEFISKNSYTLKDIIYFANSIDRDPGIVLGRLQNDGLVRYDDWRMNSIRRKYVIN